MVKCMDCTPEDGCTAVEDYDTYTVGEYGYVPSETLENGSTSHEGPIMQELFQRGPVSCSIFSDAKLKEYTGGVFSDKTHYDHTNHVVSIVGWGVDEDGTKFWNVRNSWGTYWGEDGFFKIQRGANNRRIQSACTFGVPVDTWSEKKFTDEKVRVEEKPVVEKHIAAPEKEVTGCSVSKTVFEGGELVISPRP